MIFKDCQGWTGVISKDCQVGTNVIFKLSSVGLVRRIISFVSGAYGQKSGAHTIHRKLSIHRTLF